jgi:hypothetical protein
LILEIFPKSCLAVTIFSHIDPEQIIECKRQYLDLYI